MASTLSNPSAYLNLGGNLSQGSASLQLGQTPSIQLQASSIAAYPFGSVDLLASVPFTVTSGTPYTFNLVSGTDNFGNTLNAAHLLGIIVENDSSTSGQTFTVGAGTDSVLGSDQFSVMRSGVGFIYNPDGYTVSSGSTDTITISVAAGTSVPGIVTVYARST